MLGKYLSSFQTVMCALMSILQVSVNVAVNNRSTATRVVDVFQSLTAGVVAFGATIRKTTNRFLTPSGSRSGFYRGTAIESPIVGFDREAKKEPGTGRQIASSDGSGLIKRITSRLQKLTSVMIPTRQLPMPS